MDFHKAQHNICRSAGGNFIQFKRVLIVTALVLLLLLCGWWPVSAHGSGGMLRVEGAAAGPYTLMIWTSPSMARPGEIHVETTVFNGSQRMTNCWIEVLVTPLGDRERRLRAIAGAANPANQFRHEAVFQLENPGRYWVTVSARDQEARGGDTKFEMEIVPLPIFVRGLIYVQVVIVVLALFWVVKIGIGFCTAALANQA